MNELTDALLLNAYYKAKELDLNLDFINIIVQEIRRRELFINDD